MFVQTAISQSTVSMASNNTMEDSNSNLSHIYFFINDNAANVQATDNQDSHKNTPTPAITNGHAKHVSRTSSPGSIHTTSTSSSSEMNPFAPEFSPRTEEPIEVSHPLPPPPTATQHYELRQTPDKGLALFATAKIHCGTLIISEAPLIRITGGAVHSIWGPYCRLGNTQKAEFDSLHSFKPESLNFDQQARRFLIDPNDTSLDSDDIEEMVTDQVRVMGIFSVNNFAIPPHDLGVFATASRLNHSCVPNVHHSWNPVLKMLTVYASKDIEPGEELCCTYIGGPGTYYIRTQRIELLRSNYGFICHCPACDDASGASDARREAMSSIAWGLGEYVKGSALWNPYIPRDDTAALRQAEDLISLLLTEGIRSVQLMKAYRHASKHALAVKENEKAIEYAWDEVEVERNCLGTQVDDLKKSGNSSRCWMAEVNEKTKGWVKKKVKRGRYRVNGNANGVAMGKETEKKDGDAAAKAADK